MRTFSLSFLLTFLVVLFVTVPVKQTYAQIQTSNGVCEREPVDVSIVIDFSGSMVYSATTGQAVNKLADARAAAKQLVHDLFEEKDGKIKVGLVSFSSCDNASQTSIRVPLSPESGEAALNAAIDELTMTVQQSNGHTTCTHQGVELTNQLLTSSSLGARSGVKKMTVFLTDGVPNARGKTYEQAVQATLQNVSTGVDSKVSYIMVGLGDRTGVELDEILLNCMAGTGSQSSYYGESCSLSRATKGAFWFAPTSDQLSAIYKSIAGDITNTCVTPTPTPKPSPTPLSQIQSDIQTDPSLKGLAPARTVGFLSQYCTADDLGAAYSNGSIKAYVTPQNPYAGTIDRSGTYTISNLPQANEAYTVEFTPNDPNVTCTCPIGCRYFKKTVPTVENLRFYVSPIGNAWFQTQAGDVAAQATGGVAFGNKIPDTCVAPYCSPYVSVPAGANPQSVGALITTTGGSVNLASGTVAQSPNDHSVQLTTPIACVENYNYFYRLYSMGIRPSIDFVDAGNALQPSIGTTPLDEKNAFYYEGSLPLTVSQPWNVKNNQSIVVFVKGNLNINEEIRVERGSFLAFIVSGNIAVSPDVGTTDHASATDGQVQGVYIANGAIQIKGAVSPNEKKFVGEGTFAACNGISINRDYLRAGAGLDNNKYPGALFLYRPDFVLNTPARMKTSAYNWTEVAPTTP